MNNGFTLYPSNKNQINFVIQQSQERESKMTGNFQSIANDYTSKGSTDKAITIQETSRVN